MADGTVVILHAETLGRGDDVALTERLALGTVSNMREIVQRTAAATKVVTP